MYEGIYEEESHTAISVSSHPRHRKPLPVQKGVWEWLLCRKCEQRFSRLESYAAPLLTRVGEMCDQVGRTGIPRPVVRVPEFDYTTFKLFGLSLLWRMGESSNHMFGSVRLGPHAERLRSMLLADEPGKGEEYAFTFLRILGIGFAGTLITAPAPTRFGDGAVRTYLLKAMGFEWIFLASHRPGLTGRHQYFVGNALPSLLVAAHYRDRDDFIAELRRQIPGLGGQSA